MKLKPADKARPPETEPVTFRLETETLKDFKRACETDGVRLSEGLRQLVRNFLNLRKK